ncbi:hypothetical protein [Staphylococcus edaphicus]|uniref:Uncharacterized protein n=1 Tax=Staphylococcus edaphicus TaxID=1955013 RepID=A0A2C6WLL0_9STAP|nr:hypothetical protein [Staphylococcus edaphicus]PHK48646.1 hypothetical protein BTJ66_12455 [Staphylococcus edaphicus]UQW80941.1 hypothetical protein MNY58_10165 [Staphylococcus edaphicus]
MNCQIVLKNDVSVTVENFECVKAPRKVDGEMRLFKQEDIENLNLLDNVTYTIIGDTIFKIKGEQILYLHFN